MLICVMQLQRMPYCNCPFILYKLTQIIESNMDFRIDRLVCTIQNKQTLDALIKYIA